jgi:hypothetical protein
MPIYPLLEQSAFDSDHASAMGAAFELTLVALGLINRADPLVTVVAKKIVELGQRGVRDIDQLKELAIAELTL